MAGKNLRLGLHHRVNQLELPLRHLDDLLNQARANLVLELRDPITIHVSPFPPVCLALKKTPTDQPSAAAQAPTRPAAHRAGPAAAPGPWASPPWRRSRRPTPGRARPPRGPRRGR